LKKGLSHHREAVIQLAESDNNRRIYLNKKRLLTNDKLLKIKIKHKKILNVKKSKRKHKSSRNNRDHRLRQKKRILAEIVLNDRRETTLTKATLNDITKQKSSASLVIDKCLVWVMAVACGLSVANLIYVQPLLAAMGRSFAVPPDQIGYVAMLGQLGYAIGLVLIAPLGDKYSQRSLMVVVLCAVAIALSVMAAASTVTLLVIAGYVVGMTSILTELIIPFAASLAPLNERGRIVGIMVSGVLVGTLLANVVGGFVGEYLGWRAMYWIAAGLMIILGIVLYFLLPHDRSTKSEVSYLRLLGSLWQLFCSEPVMHEISVIGILIYAAFNVFWVTLSFFLETPPYHYGSNIVGLFGLVGMVGALAASFVGNFADHKDARYANAIALPMILLSFVVMWLTGRWLVGLIIGAILLDLGVQSSHIANEARIYTLDPAAWNRLNTIYIFMFSLGGSLGCVLGTISWSIAKWNGVCGMGCLMLGVALGFYAFNGKRIRQWRKSQSQQASVSTGLVT
jgi:predicted MFS family arabinose efflux permease